VIVTNRAPRFSVKEHMSVVAEQPSTNVSLWREYRQAFREFARKAQSVQALREAPEPARASIDNALLELERARLHYNDCRDALAAALRPDSQIASAPPREHVQHIREFARLLWDFEDRRDGRADDDWYRAERIVRSAAAQTSGQLTTA
jgi:Protein of unknown function (DUF2934)